MVVGPSPQSFVGRTVKVLVEKAAGAEELSRANVFSWEHGLIRETSRHPALDPREYLAARGEADAPDIDGRQAILRVHTRLVPLGDDVDLRRIARATPGFSGGAGGASSGPASTGSSTSIRTERVTS